jgi:ribonuclease HI
MHSIGELWKASCSLGPQSSNNVAEFTAVLKLVILSKQRGITLLDVHTDSMLVIQYFEHTCDHVDQRLIALYEEIQTVVTGAMHLNFHHVKAHAKKGLLNTT